MTVKEDGSYTVTTVNGTVTGTIYLDAGKLMFRSSRPSTGTMTLYEGDGKRVLRAVATDGVAADWTSAQ
jgi:hypothetical protein